MKTETYTVGAVGEYRVFLSPGQPSLRYPSTREERKERAEEYIDAWIDEKIIDPMTVEIMAMLKSEANELCNLTEKELYELVLEAVKKVGGIK